MDTGPQPALLYLNGGGWTCFSLDTHDRLMRVLRDSNLGPAARLREAGRRPTPLGRQGPVHARGPPRQA